MHRALAHFRLGPMNLVISISLFVFFSSIWLVLLPRFCRLWSRIFLWALSWLPLDARLELVEHQFRMFRLQIPCFRMEPVLPSLQIWLLTAGLTALLFAATFLLSKSQTPIIYLLRGVLLLQGTALAYFAIWPLRFPHTPDSYMEALMTAGIGLISVVPFLFGLTYYIFDFGLLKKAFLTALTMTYLALFLPFQVLLQALILQKTVLFMPLLYIIFGMPVSVLLIIAFYSWGMTWQFRPARASR